MRQFKEAAKIVLSLTESELTVRLKRGEFVEVKGRVNKKSSAFRAAIALDTLGA